MRVNRFMVDTFTGEVHETDLFSPCVNFKGGGGGTSTSTTVNTPDYAYNARMATVAEKEQVMADEYFQFYKDYYQPMEMAQIEANKSLIPGQTQLEKEKLGLESAQVAAAQTLLPGRTNLEQEKMGLESAQTKAAQGLLPAQTEVAAERLKTTQGILQNVQQETEYSKPVMAEYYKQALTGINPNKKVEQARADVASSFAGQDAAARRAAGRMGIDPNSNRFIEGMAGRGLAQAKTTASAMSGARTSAENENFARLSGAVDTYKRNLGLGG